MQMILKSMGVKVDKDELENYAGEADEAGTGKFSFTTFCQERGEREKKMPPETEVTETPRGCWLIRENLL